MILSPSDLQRRGERQARQPSGWVSVAGRVTSSGPRHLELADALSSLRVEHRGAVAAEPGDLLVVRGRVSAKRLVRAELVWRRSLGPIPKDGEFVRVARSGLAQRLTARQRAFDTIRAFFKRRGFVEVDTPLLARTPGLDANIDALTAGADFLVTSPEFFLKRLLVGGLPRIFQLSHCFRAEELGAWHEPEFCMLEWYRAFADKDAVMADTERLVFEVARALGEKPSLRGLAGPVDVTPPFSRLSVASAFREHAGVDDVAELAASDQDRYFQLWVDRVEPALARKRRPLFLTDFPAALAALAQLGPDGRSAERFELYAGGVELCNGYGELTDPREHSRRFERERASRRKQGRPVYRKDERFMAALEEGMPEAAGNALGVDRLIAMALGSERIEKIMPFSRESR